MKLAVEYRNRTGLDAMAMTHSQLRFAMGIIREQERLQKLEMAEAVAVAISAALGNKEAWNSL